MKFGANKTMLFDVQKRIWSYGPQMSHRRRLHGCTFVPKTNKTRAQVIVVAGKHSEDTVERLDVVSKEWKTIGKTPFPNKTLEYNAIRSPALIYANSTEFILYSIGGWSSLQGYGPLKGIYGLTHSYEWKHVQNLTMQRAFHTSVMLRDILGCP